MESFNSLPEWTDAMVKRGYIYGEDGKGAFYLDKLGFKHRYRGGNKGSLLSSTIGGNGRTSNLPDWQNFGGSYYSAQAWPEMDFGNNLDPSYDPQSSVIHHGNSSNPVTDNSYATNSLNFITAQPQNKFALTEFLKLGEKTNDFNRIIDDLQNHEKKSKECICVTGLTSDKFKEFFKIKNDYIFDHDNMRVFKETYKTSIDRFLKKFVELFTKPYEINNCYRKAHFLAQAWWETDKWRTLEEYASGKSYDPPGSKAKILGNTQVGDGPKFKGRGCLQLTGRYNYTKYGKKIGIDLTKEYEDVAGKLALAVDSAAWYWHEGNAHGNLNKFADENQINLVSIAINGGSNGKKERFDQTNHLLAKFNARYCSNMRK